MVRVRDIATAEPGSAEFFADWLGRVGAIFGDSELATITAAVERLKTVQERPRVEAADWASDTDLVSDSLDIASILLELKIDAAGLLAGLLYRAVREQRLSVEAVRREFGAVTSELVVGVLKMADVGDISNLTDTSVLGQAQSANDNLRQMLVAIVDDVRVALIKLAERTCALRKVKEDAQRRIRIAKEAAGLYVPLVHRLGIGQLKWELEDLSFRYESPGVYQRIARLLDGKRVERDRYVDRVSQQVSTALNKAGVDAKTSGRAKHIFSIWRKMQRKGIGFSQVHDVRAIRILVPNPTDCYTTLGVIHGLWKTIPNEFDDYIANPKPNGYRSLHTAVVGPEGKVLEVQVRTHEMHDEAELGVCAHWRYKQNDKHRKVSVYDEKLEWLRHALALQDETGDQDAFKETLQFGADYDRVFVFTPKGDIINLMRGATPIDFAYHVHSEIGHRCRGARVNGSLVPLTTPLETGDRVQIIVGDEASPKRDWLRQGARWMVSSRARSQVLNWFRQRTRDENVASGRALLDKAFKRLAMTALDYTRLASKVQCASVDDLYAAVGSGELSAQGVVGVAQTMIGPSSGSRLTSSVQKDQASRDSQFVGWSGHRGRIHRAGCCNPLETDRVGGFVTRTRGVSVHRIDCQRWLKLVEMASDRVVEVRWESGQIAGLEVTIEVRAYDRRGLLRDVTDQLGAEGGNLIAVNTQTDRRTQMATLNLFLEVPSLAVLDIALEQIQRLPNVISAERIPQDLSHV